MGFHELPPPHAEIRRVEAEIRRMEAGIRHVEPEVRAVDPEIGRVDPEIEHHDHDSGTSISYCVVQLMYTRDSISRLRTSVLLRSMSLRGKGECVAKAG